MWFLQEKLLKVFKCYTFLWVQRLHYCSPTVSFANCVLTLYLLKVHLQTFLSIPITQKCQTLSCDILVANQRKVFLKSLCCSLGCYSPTLRCAKQCFDPRPVLVRFVQESVKGTDFSPRNEVFPPHVMPPMSHTEQHLINYSYQKNKRLKPGYLPVKNAVPGVWDHWTKKQFSVFKWWSKSWWRLERFLHLAMHY